MKKDTLQKMKRIKKICKYILIVEAIVLFVTSSYAWYRYPSTKNVQSASAEVEKVVTLSLLDDTATQSLQLFVGNLYPGQKNRMVLCISNDPMDGSHRQVEEIEYELKLAHTNNLPVNYNLYPLEKVTKDGEYDIKIEHPEENLDDTYFVMIANDSGIKTYFPYTEEVQEPTEEPTVTPAADSWINVPTYQLYNQNFNLTMNNGYYDQDYYLLEIEMPKELPDGITINEIKKEVDMVYIIATIKQLQ